MTQFLTIRGTVRGVVYEASLEPTAPADSSAREWRVTATGIPPFAVAAAAGNVWEANARGVIEAELERRLQRRGTGAGDEARPSSDVG